MNIDIIKEIDAKEYSWCDSAVLTEISGGRGVLTKDTEIINYLNDTYFRSVLMLNGKPLMQGEFPYCGTCAGLLARGCGIEKTNTPELVEIRDKINAPFTDMDSAIENIKPILGLLDDGYYVIADALLYPTDGENHYFANVSDKKHQTKATADYYISDIFRRLIDAFPAFIYPTQSNECFDAGRAKQYYDVIDKKDAPRAIAYYHRGFMCALLDGHHKAYAAAMKGVPLRTLLIIPVTGYGYSSACNSVTDTAFFADIRIPLDDKVKQRPFKPSLKDKPEFEEYSNNPVSENGLTMEFYPNLDELTNVPTEEFACFEFTDDLLKKWIDSGSDDDVHRVKRALGVLSKTDMDKAMEMTERIMRSEWNNWYLTELALMFLVRHKSEKSEKLVIDYLIDHEQNFYDPLYKLLDRYWDDSAE